MFASWNHHDYLVRLDSQLAMCLWTFWVLLHRHPATPTFNRRPGTMHYPIGPTINRASLGGFRRSWFVTWSGVGQKTLNTRYPRALSPTILVSLEPTLHYWAHCRLAMRARHHRTKSSKSVSLYIEPRAEIFMVPGQKVEKMKIFNFFVLAKLGSFGVKWGSFGVIWGHSRSFKVKTMIII